MHTNEYTLQVHLPAPGSRAALAQADKSSILTPAVPVQAVLPRRRKSALVKFGALQVRYACSTTQTTQALPSQLCRRGARLLV